MSCLLDVPFGKRLHDCRFRSVDVNERNGDITPIDERGFRIADNPRTGGDFGANRYETHKPEDYLVLAAAELVGSTSAGFNQTILNGPTPWT